MFCSALIVKNYFEKSTFKWVSLLFLTKHIFKNYFPHFEPRGASNILEMLNIQNLSTLLYNVHKISLKYTSTKYNISQYCWQELWGRVFKVSSPRRRLNSWDLTPLDSTCFFYMYGILESWTHVGVGGRHCCQVSPRLHSQFEKFFFAEHIKKMQSHISICKG